jgi:hypothetical protein
MELRRSVCCLALALSLALPAFAAEPFPGLRKVEYKDYFPVTISYDPRITQVIGKPLNAGPEHEGEPLVTRALRTRIDRAKSEEVFIDFDPGPSVDPSIVVTRVGTEEPAGSIPGLRFYIPGTGAIYASGHTNTMFDVRRKYVLQGDKLVEVKQPFYWVGLESKAKKNLVLYSGKDGKETVAHLPKGSALTVVLSEGESWYLIKTPFGLMGWLKIAGGSQEADTIEGLYFQGD